MEAHAAIRKAIDSCPEAMSSQQKLKALLRDYLPDNKLFVNMFLMAYEEGLVASISQSEFVDESSYLRYSNILLTSYGVTEDTARETIALVSKVFEKEVGILPTEGGHRRSVQLLTQSAIAKKRQSEEASPSSDFLYATNGLDIRINKYVGKGGKVVIPNTIEGLPVTRIAPSAFDWQEHDKTIIGVVLPDQLQYIGDFAFASLHKMTGTLVLPSTLVEVGFAAFKSSGLTGVVVQSDCKIDACAFAGSHELEFLHIAKNCAPELGMEAFGSAGSLADVTMPKDVVRIKDDAFEGCNQMVIFTTQGSYAEDYGKRNYIRVNTDQYEAISKSYDSLWLT